MIPKYIEHKIDRLNKLLDDAYMLKIEIESWVENKNIDTNSEEWYNIVVDNCSTVSGLFKEEIIKMLIINKSKSCETGRKDGKYGDDNSNNNFCDNLWNIEVEFGTQS